MVSVVAGGPGGLLLDTGAGRSFLPLPPAVLDFVAAGNSEPGVTTIRLPEAGARPADLPGREADIEVCFVCKKCRVAFAAESPLLTHQRRCFAGDPENRGAFRVVQPGYECRSCDGQPRFRSPQEFRGHCEDSDHRRPAGQAATAVAVAGALPPPSESPLSHEMEDVVNQITLLAARAAQEAVSDPNAGGFCQAAEPKRRFLSPADVPQPLTSAGH